MRGGFHTPAAADEPPVAVEEAQRRILDAVSPLEWVHVPLEQAAGRVLAEDVVAARDVPSYRSSAMDGYAVLATDFADASESAPVALPLAGEATAGDLRPISLESGHVIRIMTGGLVPAGADAIIPVEKTEEIENRIVVREAPRAGQHVRPAGEDIRQGARVLREGMAIDPPSLGVLASLGVLSMRVYRQPSIAILSTGDEIIEAHEEPQPGQVVNSNVWVLESLARLVGAHVLERSEIIRDDAAAGEQRLAEMIDQADVIITTGGVSVGTRDWVRDALHRLGAERLFWRVSMKPGKPIVAARLGSRLILGLPGNPVSCVVGFHLFAAPAIRRMLGLESVLPPIVRCVAGAAMRSSGSRRSYLRVRVRAEQGILVARPAPSQGSAVLSSLVHANGLAIVGPDSTEVDSGSIIDVAIIGSLV